jgi:dTMP kinase
MGSSVSYRLMRSRLTFRPKIKAALDAGTTVVVDRYYPSGIVFSAAKQDPSLSIAWCRAPDVGLPAPDLAFFLNIAPDVAALRGGGYGQEKYETKQIQDQARELFERVIDTEQKAGMEHWTVIDAGRSIDAVQADLLQQSQAVIAKSLGDLDIVKALAG